MSGKKLILENVFEISWLAGHLQASGKIEIEDSRGLFGNVVLWAEEFEARFINTDEHDYVIEITDFAERKLLDTYGKD